MLDEVVLCDIYPAREEPIPGVTSQLIYDNLKEGVEKKMIRKEDVLSFVKTMISRCSWCSAPATSTIMCHR